MSANLNRVLVVFAMTLLAVPAAAADRVPFRAAVDTTPVPVGFCGPGCLMLNITGSGHATHMGRIEIAGPSEVDLIGGTQIATSTLTAANGDTLVIAIMGTVEFEGPNPDDPVAFEGTWHVIDGTGRFENAIGLGTYSGTAAGPSGQLFMEGGLSRVGSRD